MTLPPEGSNDMKIQVTIAQPIVTNPVLRPALGLDYDSHEVSVLTPT
jgi:hypothetical protein